MPPLRKTEEEAIEVFCERYEEQPNGCWIWTAACSKGYGVMWWNNKLEKAHRIAWFLEYDVWPTYTLDHLCRTPSCVNPKHLEDIPLNINIQRGSGATAVNAQKTHCPKGHVFDTIYNNKRYCRTCINEYQRRRYALRRNI